MVRARARATDRTAVGERARCASRSLSLSRDAVISASSARRDVTSLCDDVTRSMTSVSCAMPSTISLADTKQSPIRWMAAR